MDLGLNERVYLVTGGSSGLGFASAETLVADGARVLVSSRSAEKVDAAVARLGELSRGLPADLGDPTTARRLTAAARSEFDRLDGALISVGGPPPATAAGATDDQWRSAFEQVFLGAVRLARTVAAELDEGGSIAFVLSTSARSPIAGLGISNGLRPGLAMVAKDMADEFGPRGVRVNGLLPGRFATERTLQLDAGDPGAAARRAESIPLRRYGDPVEFGRVAAFLLSPAASYVTGALVTVDGGAMRAL